jgi:hypothetical protein
VAVHGTLDLTCLPLQLLVLQTQGTVLHIKLRCQEAFTVHQREAHRMALKLLPVVQ